MTTEARTLRTGDVVKHAKPSSSTAVSGVGNVVSVFNDRVRVKWRAVRRARNYKAENLILVTA